MGLLTSPQRWSTQHALDEVATAIANLAHATVEGEEARFRFYNQNQRRDGSYRILYPTRKFVQGLVTKALTPWKEGWLGGYGRTEAFPEGLVPADILRRAFDLIAADPGEDDSALDELVALNERILARVAAGESLISAAEDEVGGAHAGSLWWRGVVAALPNEPQTPGSPAWLKEEERAKAQGRTPAHESRPNPF